MPVLSVVEGLIRSTQLIEDPGSLVFPSFENKTPLDSAVAPPSPYPLPRWGEGYIKLNCLVMLGLSGYATLTRPTWRKDGPWAVWCQAGSRSKIGMSIARARAVIRASYTVRFYHHPIRRVGPGVAQPVSALEASRHRIGSAASTSPCVLPRLTGHRSVSGSWLLWEDRSLRSPGHDPLPERFPPMPLTARTRSADC